MAIGILEPTAASVGTLEVTGTVLLEDLLDSYRGKGLEVKSEELGHLKHDLKRPEIILQPQPSDFGADPLNWSRAKKETFFFGLLFGACIMGVIGPLLVPDLLNLVKEFDVTLTQIVRLQSALVMMLGAAAPLSAILASLFGKRPVYLGSIIVFLASLLWATWGAHSYNSLLAARVLQGLGMSPLFFLGPSSISDVFFVHERGTRISIWNLSVIASVNFAPVVSGYLIPATSLQFAFGLLGVFAVILFIYVFLFVPESVYHRTAITDLGHRSSTADTEGISTTVRSPESDAHPTFFQSLKPWSGRFGTSRSATSMILQPIKLLASPVVLWCSLAYSISFGWLIITGAIFAVFFGSPPYLFSTGAIGLLSGLPPLVGTLIGTLAAGPISDFSVRWLSARNRGIFEPEQRLVLMIPCGFFTGMGAFGWGISGSNGAPWIAPAVFIAIMHIGIAFGVVGSISYVTDSFPSVSGDAFSLMMLLKSAYAFAFLFFVSNWYITRGPINFFCIMGGLSIAVALSAIPMYIYGKRARHFTQKLGIVPPVHSSS